MGGQLPPPEDMRVVEDAMVIRDTSPDVDTQGIDAQPSTIEDAGSPRPDPPNIDDARIRVPEYEDSKPRDASSPSLAPTQSDAEHVGGCEMSGGENRTPWGLFMCIVFGILVVPFEGVSFMQHPIGHSVSEK